LPVKATSSARTWGSASKYAAIADVESAIMRARLLRGGAFFISPPEV
jgi:hypothetical protein